MMSMSSKLEPAIWLHDTGQQKPCLDRCQLTITWMSSIKEVCFKTRLHVSVNLLAGVYWLLVTVEAFSLHIQQEAIIEVTHI